MTENDDTEKPAESYNQKLDPEVFDQKARQSAFELLKLLVTFSTTGVGAYFVMLTSRSESRLTDAQKPWAVPALVFLAFAAFAGIAGWGFDARYYARWAADLRGVDQYARQSKEWSRRLRAGLIWISGVCFVIGVVLSGYLAVCHH
jgi:hypothetical protein